MAPLENLLANHRKTALAVVLFAVYAVAVAWNNLSVQARLRQDLMNTAQLELEKNAGALGYFVSERHNDLSDLATNATVTNYFANRDLGMSFEYGLGINVHAVETHFDRIMLRARLAGERIYASIALLDEAGAVIATSTPARSLQAAYRALPLPSAADGVRIAMLPQGGFLHLAAPVTTRGLLRGHVVALVPVGVITRHLVGQPSKRPAAVVVAQTGRPLDAHTPAVLAAASMQRAVATLGGGGVLGEAEMPPEAREVAIAALRADIPETPLALVSIVTAEELAARSLSAFYLLGAVAAPFLVLYLVTLELRERRRMEQARREAERLAQARSEFLADMSHEIRTPLNAILGIAQLGEQQSRGRNTARHFERILQSGRHLLGVLNDILDYSKIQAGKITVEHAPVDPSEIVDNALALTAGAALDKGLSFAVEERTLPARFCGDPLRLSQVLVNLLGNAIKFTERGGVRLVLRREGNTLAIDVVDTGIGMSDEQLERLFRPFEQAEGSTTRRYGGSGLGLAISARLVQAMGGTLTAQSTPGQGSTFAVRLPMQEIVEPDPPASPAPVALVGFEHDRAAGLIADLAALGVRASAARTLDEAPPDTRLAVLAEGWLHLDADGAWHVADCVAAGLRVAVVGRSGALESSVLPETLREHLELLELPLRPRHIVRTLLTQRPAAATGARASGRLTGLRILSVDDNDLNRMVLAELLESEGASVESAESGEQALHALPAHLPPRFDLLISDVQMPGMDGYALAREVRRRHPGLPVIGLTAHAGADARTACLAAGMRTHVGKPVELESLTREILVVCRAGSTTGAPGRGTAPLPDITAPDRIVDWTTVENRFRGKREFVTRLAGTALASYREHARELRRLTQSEPDLPALARVAHTIKGSAGALAATRAAELARATDNAARAGDPRARALATELVEAVDELIEALEARVGHAEA